MNFVTDKTGKLYKKYLFASLGSAISVSIYSFVDAIAVGQSEGPAGAAAMAIITPLYGLLVCLAILTGIGGSVLMSHGKGEGKEEKGNAYFTIAFILVIGLALVIWLLFSLFAEQIFTVFGADKSSMPMVMKYAKWIIWFCPLFIIPVFLGAFVRNDGAPGLAMSAVIFGGSVNILGDWFFVFPLGMKIEGAALASVLGTSLQTLIILSYFLNKKCGLKFVKPSQILTAIKKILAIGFGASILDLGTVALMIMLNNQIMRYGGTTALAVFGVVAMIASLIQALYGGVGQAIQPLVSTNYGAGLYERIHSFFKMSLITVIIMGILFAGIGELFPLHIVKLFMATTPEVLEVAPNVIRTYSLLFMFLGITVLSTYYLQSILRDKMSMLIAVLRIVVSGILLIVLPHFFGIIGVLFALPVSEFIVAVTALFYIKKQKLHSC
jgi:putative MATE family efflux protein